MRAHGPPAVPRRAQGLRPLRATRRGPRSPCGRLSPSRHEKPPAESATGGRPYPWVPTPTLGRRAGRPGVPSSWPEPLRPPRDGTPKGPRAPPATTTEHLTGDDCAYTLDARDHRYIPSVLRAIDRWPRCRNVRRFAASTSGLRSSRCDPSPAAAPVARFREASTCAALARPGTSPRNPASKPPEMGNGTNGAPRDCPQERNPDSLKSQHFFQNLPPCYRQGASPPRRCCRWGRHRLARCYERPAATTPERLWQPIELGQPSR